MRGDEYVLVILNYYSDSPDPWKKYQDEMDISTKEAMAPYYSVKKVSFLPFSIKLHRENSSLRPSGHVWGYIP